MIVNDTAKFENPDMRRISSCASPSSCRRRSSSPAVVVAAMSSAMGSPSGEQAHMDGTDPLNEGIHAPGRGACQGVGKGRYPPATRALRRLAEEAAEQRRGPRHVLFHRAPGPLGITGQDG